MHDPARRGAEVATPAETHSYEAHFRVWRGDADGGELVDYTVEVNEGEVVLDIIHRLQATQAGDLAVRWNCKAGKCGSCSAEINGRPRLMCMTRMSTFTAGRDDHRHADAHVPGDASDLVTDVSFNYKKAQRGAGVRAAAGSRSPGEYRMAQVDVERSQEFRKCIECFLCQNVCHVDPRPRGQQGVVRRPALPHAGRRTRHAPARRARPPARRAGRARPRAVQHHQVLHRGLPRAHQDHRQRADPAQGARRRPQVRPARLAGQQDRPATVAREPFPRA